MPLEWSLNLKRLLNLFSVPPLPQPSIWGLHVFVSRQCRGIDGCNTSSHVKYLVRSRQPLLKLSICPEAVAEGQFGSRFLRDLHLVQPSWVLMRTMLHGHLGVSRPPLAANCVLRISSGMGDGFDIGGVAHYRSRIRVEPPSIQALRHEIVQLCAQLGRTLLSSYGTVRHGRPSLFWS
jgi:hypothetical protein